MSRLFLLLLSLLVLFSAPLLAAEDFRDIPLPDGVSVQKEEAFILFPAEPPEYPELFATGFVDVDSAYYFYERELPRRGWKKISPRLYQKGAVFLHVSIKATLPDGKTRVHLFFSGE